MKATYGEVFEHRYSSAPPKGREIYKDPITDDGTKKSAKGLLQVYEISNPHLSPEENGIFVKDQCSWEEERRGLLETVFLNGELVKFQTLQEIRDRIKEHSA